VLGGGKVRLRGRIIAPQRTNIAIFIGRGAPFHDFERYRFLAFALAATGLQIEIVGQAVLFRPGRINTSPEIPSRSCRPWIIAIDSPRFRFSG
jgi:hypothetical protein